LSSTILPTEDKFSKYITAHWNSSQCQQLKNSQNTIVKICMSTYFWAQNFSGKKLQQQLTVKAHYFQKRTPTSPNARKIHRY